MSSDIFGRKCLNRKVQNANHARGSTKIQGHKYKTLWTQKLTCKTCRFLFRRKNKILSEIEHHQSQNFLFSSSFQWIWSTQPLFPFLIKRIDGIKPTLKVAFPVLLFQWIWSGSGSDGIKPRLKFQFSFLLFQRIWSVAALSPFLIMERKGAAAPQHWLQPAGTIRCQKMAKIIWYATCYPLFCIK